MRVAIPAPHPMDVVLAGSACVSCIHCLDVEAAFRSSEMAGLARSSGVLVVTGVTGKAAEAFMYARRRAVIAGAGLHAPVMNRSRRLRVWQPRSMTLVTERLPLIGTHADRPGAVIKPREVQQRCSEVHLFPAIEERQRCTHHRARSRNPFRRLALGRSLAVDHMTSPAGHRRLIGEAGASNPPWTGLVLRLHKIPDRTVIVHAVAAEAVFHQRPLRIFTGISKDLLIGGAVGTGAPGGVFLLVAALATTCHSKIIDIAQMNILGKIPEKVHADVPQLRSQILLVAIHTVQLAVCRHVSVSDKLCHLMAARAS